MVLTATQNGQKLGQWSKVQPNKEIDIIVPDNVALTDKNYINFHGTANQPIEATLYYQQEGGKQNALVYKPINGAYVEAKRNFDALPPKTPSSSVKSSSIKASSAIKVSNSSVKSSSSVKISSSSIKPSSIISSSSSSIKLVIPSPTIQTLDMVTGQTNDQTINPETNAAITDSATLSNLQVGKQYTATFNETDNGTRS